VERKSLIELNLIPYILRKIFNKGKILYKNIQKSYAKCLQYIIFNAKIFKSMTSGIPLSEKISDRTRIFRFKMEVSQMNIVDIVEKEGMRTDLPKLAIGDTVRVNVKIKEGDKERIQAFEGVIIAFKNGSIRETFTVRRVSFGIGVERTFPLHSPKIDSIKIVRHGRVRRAKLYYLRNKFGKAARLREIVK